MKDLIRMTLMSLLIGVIDLSDTRHLKNRERFDTYSMASASMVELVYVKMVYEKKETEKLWNDK